MRILMMHGAWQSGEIFRTKTETLRTLVQRALGRENINFVYPTGHFEHASTDDSAELRDQQGTYCWWQADNVDGVYPDLKTGLESIVPVLKDSGPFDGIIGFSQGGAMAGMITSLLEEHRHDSFAQFQKQGGMEYPGAFASLNHPPLKFMVGISGYASSDPAYRAFYEPSIGTPSIHLLGDSDQVVRKEDSMRLVRSCRPPSNEASPMVVWHPGGHFVPSEEKELEPVVQFIKSRAC